MICRIPLVAALASLVLTMASAEEAPRAEGEHWQLEVRAANDGAMVMAVPKANPKQAAKLCETVSVNTTRVFLSSDDDIAVVESGSASLGTSLQLFLLTEGTEYQELKDWDVTEAVQKAWEKSTGKKASRSALHFIAWSADAKAGLVCWGGGKDKWYAVVDFDKKTVGNALSRLNQKPKSE